MQRGGCAVRQTSPAGAPQRLPGRGAAPFEMVLGMPMAAGYDPRYCVTIKQRALNRPKPCLLNQGEVAVPYVAEISRTNPACFLFLIDQSGSMCDPISGGTQRKADVVSDAINRWLQMLTLSCARTEGIRDYFHVGVIGYGSTVGPAFGGVLSGRCMVPLSEAGNNPLRVEQRTKQVPDGAGGLVSQTVKFPVWFEPVANDLTPMCQALELAWSVVNDFIMSVPGCYPPIVINITDGEATDGDPEPNAAMIRELASRDGNALLFNMHVSSRSERPIEFPDNPNALPDDWARMLFRMSSKLPPRMMVSAKAAGFLVSEANVGFAFNGDTVSLIRFLDIGTRVDAKNLR